MPSTVRASIMFEPLCCVRAVLLVRKKNRKEKKRKNSSYPSRADVIGLYKKVRKTRADPTVKLCGRWVFDGQECDIMSKGL